MAYTHIEPGSKIEVSCHVYSSLLNTGVAELTKLPVAELVKLEQASIEQEKAIFSRMCALESEWTQQAEQTVRLRQAQQYLRTPAVEHTSNQWIEKEYDWHELSNMVYKMTWRLYEGTNYNQATRKSRPIYWELTWSVYFNTPRDPDSTRTGWKIAGQDRKRFGEKTAMEKYLQGRIAAYAHLFTEISPPIPKGEENRFSINGVLLPGYTVETPERTPQEAADELLALLDDEDIEILSQKGETGLPTEPSASAPAPRTAPKQHQTHRHKKPAPTR